MGPNPNPFVLAKPALMNTQRFIVQRIDFNGRITNADFYRLSMILPGYAVAIPQDLNKPIFIDRLMFAGNAGYTLNLSNASN